MEEENKPLETDDTATEPEAAAEAAVPEADAPTEVIETVAAETAEPDTSAETAAEQTIVMQPVDDATAAQPAAQPAYQAPPQATAQMPAMQTPPPATPGTTPAGYAPYGAPMPANMPSATAPLVCGILSIVFSFIPIAGIVLGIVAIVLAGKFYKAGGIGGGAKGGRICGIIGIVFSVLMILLNLLLVFAIITLDADDVSYSSSTSTTPAVNTPAENTNANTDAAAPSDEMVAREEINAVVSQRLDLIKNRDPQMMAALAKIADESFSDAFGDEITMAECGITPEEYVTLMIEGFDYELMDISDIDATDISVDAYYYLTMRDVLDVISNFSDLSDEVMDDLPSMTRDEAAAEVGRMLRQSIEDTKVTDENILMVTLDKKGSTWTIDDDEWDDEMDFLFGII